MCRTIVNRLRSRLNLRGVSVDATYIPRDDDEDPMTILIKNVPE